jgi:phosphoribosylglycinamide formyltransferase 1
MNFSYNCRLSMKTCPRLAVFASGSGSNAQRLAEYFAGSGIAEVSVIYCNNPDAYVLERARLLGIPAVLIKRDSFYNDISVLDDLKSREIDWVILAGFLWLVPDYILKAFPKRILNIHPALLPAYGGKGMYGMKVHQAVIAARESESGITIHYVNEKYDEGDIVFQAKCPIEKEDTPEMLAAKIHKLEYGHFPSVIANLIAAKVSN